MMLKNCNKKKILDFIANFSDIAKKNRWISHYDADDDSMVIRVPRLSMDARKHYINNDEFAFYLNSKGEVEGVFIEYFLSNFVAHHKDFKEVGKELKEQKAKDDEVVVTLNKTEMKKFVPELQEAIIESIMPTRKLEETSSR
jgi:hypothetical protein